MKQIFGIRCHTWGVAEERLHAELGSAGIEAVPVFHDTGKHPVPQGATAINDELLGAMDLRIVPDWGWRCGDYALYALRLDRSGYDYYWLIEPDVFLKGDVAEFVAQFSDAKEDLLGLDPSRLGVADHLFARRLKGLEHWKATFALTRMSARLVDRLYELRIADSEEEINPRLQPNDELFCYSHTNSLDGYDFGNLRTYAPEWFKHDLFATDPDMLRDWLANDEAIERGIFHPVREKEQFLKILAERMTFRARTLRKMAPSIARLSDGDVLRAKELASKVFEDSLLQARRIGRRRSA